MCSPQHSSKTLRDRLKTIISQKIIQSQWRWLECIAIMKITKERHIRWWLSPLRDVWQSDNILSGGGTAWIPSRWTDISLKSVSIWLTHLDSKTDRVNSVFFYYYYYCLYCRSVSQWLTSSENHFTSSVFLQITNRWEEGNSPLMTRLLLPGPVDLLLMPLMFCALQGAAHNYLNTSPSFFFHGHLCLFQPRDRRWRDWDFFLFFANKLGIQFKGRHQSVVGWEITQTNVHQYLGHIIS